MKIGIVTNSAWNIYNFRRGLVETLINNNHELVAIAPDDGFSQQIISLGCKYIPVKLDPKGANPFKDFKLMLDLQKIYKQEKLELVLHYTVKPNIYGTLAARLASISAVNNVTGLGTLFIRKNLKSLVGQSLYKIAFRYPDVVFFQNADDREIFLNKKLVKKEITDLLPGSGIDTEQFTPESFNRNKVFTFLLVARVLIDKGIGEYVAAIRKLRLKGINCRFQLLGGLDEQSGMGISKEALAIWEDEGLIEYLGKVDNVKPLMRASDCVVLPSYREGTPRSLLEAASLGKPIITTNAPGCKETVIHNFNGYLCKVKDADDLAEKMLKMSQLSDERLLEMGNNSRQYAVKKFDEKKVFFKYGEAIDHCVNVKLVKNPDSNGRKPNFATR